MQFKKFILEDYLCSNEGDEIREKFLNLKSMWDEYCGTDVEARRKTAFYKFVSSFLTRQTGYLEDAFDKERIKISDDDTINLDDFEVEEVKYPDISSFTDGMKFKDEDGDISRSLQICIPYISLQLFFKYPEYAFPYLLPRHYYKLQIICREFGIDLPHIPRGGDYLGRANYYFDICKAMYEFRVKANLSPLDMCVFFYGFAMRFVDDVVRENIKRTSQVYFLYANAGDSENFLDKGLDADDVTIWQGRPEMQPGDTVLIYETSPRSRISSIWKTVTPGFDDPFAWYMGAVFIGDPIAVPPISLVELKQNPVWGNLSLVKANMRGGSKRICPPECYKELLVMIEAKSPDFDVNQLPPVPKTFNYDEVGLVVEHDVEVNLLEPFLRNLGFSEHDWVRQFSIRIGRENTSRPDYVINLTKTGTTVRADFVFEAKLSIPTKRQLSKDFGQVLAYGKLLLSKVIALVSREGVWLSLLEDEFAFDHIRYYDWDQLKDAEVIAQVRTLFVHS